MIPAQSAVASGAGRVEERSHENTSVPFAAPAPTSGSASTKAATITQPKPPESSTDRTMPRGTLCAASRVSSAACAEASYPVMV